MLEHMIHLHKMVCLLHEKIKDKQPEDWLTLHEACRILNVSENKVRQLHENGRIGFVRYGRKAYYKAGDIIAILHKEGQKV